MDDYQEGNLPDAVKERLLAQLPEYLRDTDLDELFSNPDMRYHLWSWLGYAESQVLHFSRLLMAQPEFTQFWDSFSGQDFLALDLFSQP
ncbi:hypothetical protein V8F33_005947 [Rhypophila sp. PSN 637]